MVNCVYNSKAHMDSVVGFIKLEKVNLQINGKKVLPFILNACIYKR